jgi:hypothetical protein
MLPASTLLDSFDESEARILAEDDRYAVIGVRIDKAAVGSFMMRNLPFLAALAELRATPKPALVEARPCNGCPFDRICDHVQCRIA